MSTRRTACPIGVFTSGTGPPLVLVHGTAGDHTTFRVVGPMLAARRTVHAIDRRGRGASGDAAPYAIEREFDDVAAVARAIAGEAGERVDVVGHSYGGRCALGAALRTDAIARVVCYEGAPPPPDVSYQPAGLEARAAPPARRRPDGRALATFLTRVVGMPPAELAAYRDDPVWPVRVATAATIVRELEAERSPAAGLDALGAVRQPVLQILGGESLPVFPARRPPSTSGSRTAASSSSRARGMRPTTPIPRPSWPRCWATRRTARPPCETDRHAGHELARLDRRRSHRGRDLRSDARRDDRARLPPERRRRHPRRRPRRLAGDADGLRARPGLHRRAWSSRSSARSSSASS